MEQRPDECADAHNGLAEKVQEYEITMHSPKTKIADLEDQSWRNNIRIRGIPETVLPTGLNDYLQDMFQALTPAIHPDQLVVDRVHRLRRPQHLPATAERDVIARIHFFHAKELIASRTAEMSDPYGHIKMFADLSAETLQYRKNLAQITATLREKKIADRWGYPAKLLIHYEGKMHTISNLDTGLAKLNDWGIQVRDA
ncbi:Hypothetical predicted protein [Pelobates cultripes]|uniref:Uncharacterized protein n=1 Tax=Pelobates cultripes TaxID=61616 RepID=A0AAD1TJY6_PELCU|nr:Hypothetical predicted protein [Pelobates cultripes]